MALLPQAVMHELAWRMLQRGRDALTLTTVLKVSRGWVPIQSMCKPSRDKHLSFIFISHDLELVSSVSHRVIVLKDGSIVEEGLSKNILKTPSHPYTQKLLEN